MTVAPPRSWLDALEIERLYAGALDFLPRSFDDARGLRRCRAGCLCAARADARRLRPSADRAAAPQPAPVPARHRLVRQPRLLPTGAARGSLDFRRPPRRGALPERGRSRARAPGAA